MGTKTSTLMRFDTTKAGSAATALVLPFVNGGTYACMIKWGDGSQNYVTAWNDAALTHTYATSGTYDVEIIGTCNGWRYGNGGDRLKLMVIKRWGKDFRLGNTSEYFYGCANLTITATDILNLTGTTTFASIFRGCSVLTTVPSMNKWNTSAITTTYYAFSSASLFNQNISLWDMSNVITTERMFWNAGTFNQNISLWDMSKNANISIMFYNAILFNQNLGSWNVATIATAADMFTNVTLSTANYDALLIGWSAQAVKDSVSFGAGSSKYSAGAAATARDHLVTTHLWTILDGGQVA